MKTKEFYGYTVYEDGSVVNHHGRTLKHRTRDTGRREIKLVINGKKKNFVSARLIYCVFNDLDVFTLSRNQCVTFIDDDKSNIHLSNLKLVHRSQLIHGEKHDSISKITDEQAKEIREKYELTKENRPVNQYDKTKPYNSYRSLAKEYDVTYSLIRQIIEGDTRNKEKYKLKKERLNIEKQ